jgi:Ca2+-binding RTX toxin-like protein
MPNFQGSEDGETLIGTADPDVIEALGGNDVIDGAGGADIMKGGSGDDLFLVDDPGDQAVELSGQGNDEIRTAISFALASQVENLVLVGSGAIDGIGNSLNNRITGNDSANRFYDGGGSDTFIGGGGDDYFYVRAEVLVDGSGGYAFSGVDQVIEAAGGGTDTIESNVSLTLPVEVENIILIGSLDLTAFGNSLSNSIIGNSGRNFLRGGEGDDYIDGGAGNDNIDGGEGNDKYGVYSAQDILTEAPNGGTDTVRSSISLTLGFSFENLILTGAGTIDGKGNSRDNVILGNDSANILSGDGGNDRVEGAGGDDRVDGGFGDDIISGGAGDDVLRGGAGNDNSRGDEGNDLLYADEGGADFAFGGEGNDGFFFGNRLDANDVVDGGSGSDTLAIRGLIAPGFRFSASHLIDVEVLLLASGANTSFQPGTAIGSFSYDLATVDENVAAGGILTIVAGSPGQGVSGPQAGEALRFDGSAETDGGFRLFAGLGSDTLPGGSGSDGFFFETGGLTAADRIQGGSGIDSIALRGAYDGAKLVLDDATFGGVEVLALLTGHAAPFGGAVTGPVGTGGFSYDIVAANGNVAAGSRLDVSATSLATDEVLSFDGRAESDGSFRLLGGAGNDLLRGGTQGDSLYGGLGADQLDGGAGADIYIYRSTADSRTGATDLVTFSAGDRIDLSLIDAGSATAQDDAFALLGAGAFTGAGGELRIYESSAGLWMLEADVDGDLVADLVIGIAGSTALQASDFLL